MYGKTKLILYILLTILRLCSSRWEFIASSSDFHLIEINNWLTPLRRDRRFGVCFRARTLSMAVMLQKRPILHSSKHFLHRRQIYIASEMQNL